MRKIYGIKCEKHIQFKNVKIPYIQNKTLVLSTPCTKCGSKVNKIFKEEESSKVLKILGFIN